MFLEISHSVQSFYSSTLDYYRSFIISPSIDLGTSKVFTRELLYFLRLTLLGRCLHTGEVTGSNPVSPIPFPETAISFASPLECSRGITKKIVLEAYRFYKIVITTFPAFCPVSTYLVASIICSRG